MKGFDKMIKVLVVNDVLHENLIIIEEEGKRVIREFEGSVLFHHLKEEIESFGFDVDDKIIVTTIHKGFVGEPISKSYENLF